MFSALPTPAEKKNYNYDWDISYRAFSLPVVWTFFRQNTFQ